MGTLKILIISIYVTVVAVAAAYNEVAVDFNDRHSPKSENKNTNSDEEKLNHQESGMDE